MNWKSYADLVKDVSAMARMIPKPDLVIGVPRSGMIPALIMGLHWNVPVESVNRPNIPLGSGPRLREYPEEPKRILLVDDSHNTGKSMDLAYSEVKKYYRNAQVDTCAIYVKSSDHNLTYAGKKVPQGRIFEWNWLHHDPVIPNSCWDMDGCICEAPTSEQNDYGPKYEKFLAETQPKFVSTLKLGSIITGRLEKYRPQTEAWLKKHGIQYGELLMRPDRETNIIVFKANHYKNKKSYLFVEDEPSQARMIAANSGKSVLCVTEMVMYYDRT